MWRLRVNYWFKCAHICLKRRVVHVYHTSSQIAFIYYFNIFPGNLYFLFGHHTRLKNSITYDLAACPDPLRRRFSYCTIRVMCTDPICPHIKDALISRHSQCFSLDDNYTHLAHTAEFGWSNCLFLLVYTLSINITELALPQS